MYFFLSENCVVIKCACPEFISDVTTVKYHCNLHYVIIVALFTYIWVIMCIKMFEVKRHKMYTRSVSNTENTFHYKDWMCVLCTLKRSYQLKHWHSEKCLCFKLCWIWIRCSLDDELNAPCLYCCCIHAVFHRHTLLLWYQSWDP